MASRLTFARRGLLGCFFTASVFATADEWTFRVKPSIPPFRLYPNEDTYPRELEVLKEPSGNGFVQALDPAGGIDPLLPARDIGSEPWLKTEDLNFDGYQDLGLLVSHSEEAAITQRRYWTYDPKAGRFVYQPLLSEETNVVPDPRKQEVETFSTEAFGSPNFERKVWRWSGARARPVRRERQSWLDQQRCYLWIVEEYRQASWVQVERGCQPAPHQ